jgi:hypothetical protein
VGDIPHPIVFGEAMSLLRTRRDYGSTNPYLNTPPTKLKELIEKEKDSNDKRLMEDALSYWRSIYRISHVLVEKTMS